MINTADSGAGSLRQAITDANAAGGGTVAFNIPSAPRTITLSSSLPLAGPAVVIDGTAQPGYAGDPLIEISGANIPLPLSLSNPCVRTSGILRGVAVNRCYADVEGTGAPVIAANWIGLNLAGGFATPNIHGIHLTPGSSGAVVGGSSFTDGNIISATNDAIFSDSASNVTISHNHIGTSPSGNVYVGGPTGINLENGSNVSITSNTIAAENYGIQTAYMSGLNIKNNTFTPDATITNTIAAILLFHTSNVTVGDATGGGNTITDTTTGVLVLSGINNPIRGNSIDRTSGLGIDLSNSATADGQTPNDPGDADTGPNNLQNYPVLTGVGTTGAGTSVSGTFNSAPGQSFTIDFYWDDGPCAGRGQARNYLGNIPVTTDANGNALIYATLPETVPTGASVSATATDSDGNTSELAPCSAAVAAIPAVSPWTLIALVVTIALIALMRLR